MNIELKIDCFLHELFMKPNVCREERGVIKSQAVSIFPSGVLQFHGLFDGKQNEAKIIRAA